MAEVRGAPPPALMSRPRVLPGLGCYFEAFGVLSAARGAGLGGPLPIRLSEIESYCRLTGWGETDAVAELVAIVQALDAVYLEAAARGSRRGEAESPTGKAPDCHVRVDPGGRFSPAWSRRRD